MATGKPIVDLQTDPPSVGELDGGDTLLLNASTTAGAPLRIPPGTAPTSPVNGDIWATSAGIYARVDGATHGPLVSLADASVVAALAGKQNADADLDALASSGIAGQWTLWTPTLSSSTGTLTSASATARYLKVGRRLDFWIIIAITTAGTAAGQLRFTLPGTLNANGPGNFLGRQTTATAFFCAGFVNAASNVVSILKLDETTVIADGRSVRISGTVEVDA